jgi:hypothetical protein
MLADEYSGGWEAIPKLSRSAERWYQSKCDESRTPGIALPPRSKGVAACVLLLFRRADPGFLAEGPSSKVVVDKKKLTFDPKTCTEGHGLFFWGHGSCAVKILGHKDGHCVFEYTEEVEMGHTIYLVRVPVDSGPVTIEEGTVTKGKTSYTGIITSFPLDKAKVVRRGGPGGHWEVRVGDTDEFVGFGPAERRSEMEPRKGDTVKFRFLVYDGPDFKRRMPNARFDPSVEFVVGGGKAWAWLETAMEHMTVGDARQVHVSIKIAEGAKKWLPDPDAVKTLYVEIRLVSLERAK